MDMGTEQALDTARNVGLDPDGLKRLERDIAQDIQKGICDGAVWLVARGGQIASHQARGLSHKKKQRVARTDDVFHVMSVTKQFTTTLVLAAIDRGDLDLDMEVREIIPEFGSKGKQRVTVEHLLTHRSGLNTELPGMTFPHQFLNIRLLVELTCKERLFQRPGEVVSYNAMTAHAVLAEMVRRVDPRERPFPRILAEDLFAPLGMKDSSLVMRKDLASRHVPIVARYGREGLFEPKMLESLNHMYNEVSEFPAGGSISTAMDVFRFSEMMRRGGTLDGARILSPEIVNRATTVQTGTLRNTIFDYAREMRGWPDWPANIGLTWFMRGEGDFPTHMGLKSSPRTYSAQGAGSTLVWVDPERDLSFVFLSSGVLEDSDNILRFQRLSDLVIDAALD